jgi:hypothetical protein
MNREKSRTNLLILLVALSIVACLIAAGRLARAHDAAASSSADLSESRALLADLAASKTGASPSPAAPTAPEVNQRLKTAAAAAGIVGKIRSIEPGQPNRLPNADYMETPVFVRTEPLTLRQLATFLLSLAQNDASCRAKMIELAVPQSPDGGAAAAKDVWTADVTLAYTSYVR